MKKTKAPKSAEIKKNKYASRPENIVRYNRLKAKLTAVGYDCTGKSTKDLESAEKEIKREARHRLDSSKDKESVTPKGKNNEIDVTSLPQGEDQKLSEQELLDMGATDPLVWAHVMMPHVVDTASAGCHRTWMDLLMKTVRYSDVHEPCQGGRAAPVCGVREGIPPTHFSSSETLVVNKKDCHINKGKDSAGLEGNCQSTSYKNHIDGNDSSGPPQTGKAKPRDSEQKANDIKGGTNVTPSRSDKAKLSRRLKKLVIAAPRGHAKTTILMIFMLWCICYRMKNFILLISDSEDQSKLHLDAIKAELESNELLRKLYGDLVGKYWGAEAIETSTGIRVQCRGAGQRIRGLKYRQFRPDLVVCDDLLNDELVETDDRRVKLKRWFFGAVMPALAKEGAIVVVGTILHEADLLSELLESGIGWVSRRYSAMTEGVALWPEQYSQADLDRIREEYEEKGELSLYFREYFNQIVGNEECPFKRDDFRYISQEEFSEKFKLANLQTFITWDPAYTRERSADFTAMVVTSLDHKRNWYVRRVLRGKWDHGTQMDVLFNLVQLYTPLGVGIQKNDWSRIWKEIVTDEMRRRNIHFPVRPLQSYSPTAKGLANKQSRIGRLAKYYQSGSIYHLKGASGINFLEAELLAYPYAKKDDCGDGLSMMCDIAFPPSERKTKKYPDWYYNQDVNKVSGY